MHEGCKVSPPPALFSYPGLRGGASRARPTNLHAGQEERPAEAPPSLQRTSFPPGRPLRRRGPPRPPLVLRSPSPAAPPVRSPIHLSEAPAVLGPNRTGAAPWSAPRSPASRRPLAAPSSPPACSFRRSTGNSGRPTWTRPSTFRRRKLIARVGSSR